MSLPDGWTPERVEKVRLWAERNEVQGFEPSDRREAARFVLDVLAQADQPRCECVMAPTACPVHPVVHTAADGTRWVWDGKPDRPVKKGERYLWVDGSVAHAIRDGREDELRRILVPAPAESAGDPDPNCPRCGTAWVQMPSCRACPSCGWTDTAEGAGEEGGLVCPRCGSVCNETRCECEPDDCPAFGGAHPTPPAAPVGADQQDRGQQPCGICGSSDSPYFVRVTDQRAGRPDPRLWCAACWERQHALNAAAPPSIPVPEGLRDLLGEAWKALDAAPDTPDMAHLLNRLNDAYIDLGGAPAPDPLPAREQLVKALIETCNPARRPSEWAVSLIADHADTLRAAADAADERNQT